MTPNDIDVLLHYYVCTEHHPRADAPWVKDSLRFWIKEEILVAEADPIPQGCHGLVISERGECFIKELLATPLPVTKWVVERP